MRGSAALTPSESETETRTPPSYAAFYYELPLRRIFRDRPIVGYLIESERQEQTGTHALWGSLRQRRPVHGS